MHRSVSAGVGAREQGRAVIAVGISFLGVIVATSAWVGMARAEDELVVRKSVMALTAEEKADFVTALHRLKTTPSPEGDEVGNWYDHFVAAHMRKLICYTDEPGQGGYGHNGPDLITWHRKFMLEFEAAMSVVMGKPMAIPYWDYTDPASTDVVLSDDFMGPGGDPDNGYFVMSGPFRYGYWRLSVKGFESTNPGQFDYLVRAIGTVVEELPSAEEVQQALLRPSYDAAPWGVATDQDKSFRSFVDGMVSATGSFCDGGAINVKDISAALLHGTVHMWVGGSTAEGHGGSMADTVTSPNDPIFWLHHANIDRIAESWWVLHDYEYLPISGGPRGTNLGDKMWPYGVTHQQIAVPTADLGYSYDELIALDPASEFIGIDDWIERRGHAGGHSH